MRCLPMFAILRAVGHGEKRDWGTLQPLGPFGIEARLSPDRATLYYSGADKRIHRFSLAAWRRHLTRS